MSNYHKHRANLINEMHSGTRITHAFACENDIYEIENSYIHRLAADNYGESYWHMLYYLHKNTWIRTNTTQTALPNEILDACQIWSACSMGLSAYAFMNKMFGKICEISNESI